MYSSLSIASIVPVHPLPHDHTAIQHDFNWEILNIITVPVSHHSLKEKQHFLNSIKYLVSVRIP